MMTSFTTFRLSYALPGLLTLALAACSGYPEYASEESAVAVTGSGLTVDVLPINSWQGGFNGAVRITNTAFESPITSFEIGFRLGGSASIAPLPEPWNGNVTIAADASGNRTATNPDWLQFNPIQRGQTWDVGFTGTGTFTDSTIVIVIINGHVIIIIPPPPDPPCLNCGDGIPPVVDTLVSSATTVTAAGSITLMATASDNVGVTRVEFFDGTARLGTYTTAPFTQTVALTSANNGTHFYTARAFDAAGNNATSMGVTVNVSITSL